MTIIFNKKMTDKASGYILKMNEEIFFRDSMTDFFRQNMSFYSYGTIILNSLSRPAGTFRTQCRNFVKTNGKIDS